jgi:hypothetical protein
MDPFAWFCDLRIAAVGEVLDGKLAALFEHLGIAAPDQLLTATPCPPATRAVALAGRNDGLIRR